MSRLLTERFGTGYQRANIFRMLRVAREFPDEQIAATLSHQLTWFIDKMNRSIAIARELQDRKEAE